MRLDDYYLHLPPKNKKTSCYSYWKAKDNIGKGLPVTDQIVDSVAKDPTWTYMLLSSYHKNLSQEHKDRLLAALFIAVVRGECESLYFSSASKLVKS